MNYRKRVVFGTALWLLGISLAAGCASAEKEAGAKSAETGSEMMDTSEMFTSRDLDFSYEESSAVKIQLSDEGSICDSEKVEISDSVITISDEGTYLLYGSLTEGQILVDAEDTDKLQLVLDNASVNCSTSAALYVRQADKVFVTLADGSENHLSNQEDFIAVDDNNVDAVIFSKDDLTLNGTGSLSISAAYGHGIVSKDDLVLTGGNYQITAASHALSGKDSVRIAEGNFQLNSGKDGIQSDYSSDTEEASDDRERGFIYIAGGEFQIIAGDDGMQASSFAQIADGTFSIQAADDGIHADAEASVHSGEITISECYEGIEGQTVKITGGSISITAEDDGLNAAGGNDQSSFAGGQQDPFAADENCEIRISGGTVTINASGDGIDSNGNLYVSDGEIYVSGPENDGNGALDYAGEAQISGGTVVAAGGSGMAQNFGEGSSQGAMLVNLSEWTEGTVVLTDSSGTEVISCTPEKKYNSVLISTPQIQQGETYTLTAGGQENLIEMSELLYGAGGMGGRMGGPGQRRGQDGETEPPEGMEERPEGEMKPHADMGERPEGGMEPPEGMEGRPEGGMEPSAGTGGKASGTILPADGSSSGTL